MMAPQSVFEAVWMPELTAAVRLCEPLRIGDPEERARQVFDLDAMYIRYLIGARDALPK